MEVVEIRVVQDALTSEDPEAQLTREAKASLRWLDLRSSN